MKKHNSILFSLFIAGSLLITSCKKDDVTNPVVTLTGSDMTVSLQGTFNDPGATANDNKDGKLSPAVSGNVNTNLKGVYDLTYTATDAAGNSGSAVRRVTVVNDADGINGSYNVAGTQTSGGAGTYSYTQTITASSTQNNRIIFGKFGDYVGNSSVYADIVGSNVTMPSQTAIQVGNPPANRTFSGTGSKGSNSITLNYTETTTGGGGGFTEIMTKQ